MLKLKLEIFNKHSYINSKLYFMFSLETLFCQESGFLQCHIFVDIKFKVDCTLKKIQIVFSEKIFSYYLDKVGRAAKNLIFLNLSGI